MSILEKAKELQALPAADLDAATRAELDNIELDVTRTYKLSDLIREGSKVSKQKVGDWGEGEEACALTAGVIGGIARGVFG